MTGQGFLSLPFPFPRISELVINGLKVSSDLSHTYYLFLRGTSFALRGNEKWDWRSAVWENSCWGGFPSDQGEEGKDSLASFLVSGISAVRCFCVPGLPALHSSLHKP